jgi:hypothetical protein
MMARRARTAASSIVSPHVGWMPRARIRRPDSVLIRAHRSVGVKRVALGNMLSGASCSFGSSKNFSRRERRLDNWDLDGIDRSFRSLRPVGDARETAVLNITCRVSRSLHIPAHVYHPMVEVHGQSAGGWVQRMSVVSHKTVLGRPFSQHLRKAFGLRQFLLAFSAIWYPSYKRRGRVIFIWRMYHVKIQMPYMCCRKRTRAMRLTFEVCAMYLNQIGCFDRD